MIVFSTIPWITWLTVIVTVLLPMVVALVTARVADGAVKALVLLVLAALTGFGSAWLDALEHGWTFDPNLAALNALVAFLLAVGAHFGLLEPANVTGSTGVIQARVPGGVGSRSRA